MKGFDYGAVVYDGEEYCVGCLPDGVTVDSRQDGELLVSPIFATAEMDRYPVCGACGEEHTYVGLTQEGRRALLSRGHMTANVEFGTWLEVETGDGTVVIAADLAPAVLAGMQGTLTNNATDFDDRIAHLRDFFGLEDIREVARINGYGARLSASGYMDCTDWSVYETEQQAWDSLWEQYGE